MSPPYHSKHLVNCDRFLSLILLTNWSLSFERGIGSFGIGTSKNLHKGAQPSFTLQIKSFSEKHRFVQKFSNIKHLPLGIVSVTCSIQRVYIFATSWSFHFCSLPSQILLAQISWFIRRPGMRNPGIQRMSKLNGNFPTSGTLPNFSTKIVSRTKKDFQLFDNLF